MKQEDYDSFPAGIAGKLKTYVYRLIDPRDGQTFYIGKGQGNRVFAHIRAEQSIGGDDLDNKMKRIREIRLAGFEVAHIIHRHGMDEATAFHVESALMDAYPGLANIATGVGSSDYGASHALDIIRRYSAEPAVFHHRAILISVNRSASERTSIYEAARYAWVLSKVKAERAEVILATVQGIIVDAFVADKWMEATVENFPELLEASQLSNRIGFVGREAPDDLKHLYVGRRVPDEFRRRGASNPVKYTWGKLFDSG